MSVIQEQKQSKKTEHDGLRREHTIRVIMHRNGHITR